MRLILLAVVLVLGVMNCESYSTRKWDRCEDTRFRFRLNHVKKHSDNEAKKRIQCGYARQLTKRCFKMKKMSEEELFDKWFSQCNKKVEGEASSKREENKKKQKETGGKQEDNEKKREENKKT